MQTGRHCKGSVLSALSVAIGNGGPSSIIGGLGAARFEIF
jgi:hypothetical protein